MRFPFPKTARMAVMMAFALAVASCDHAELPTDASSSESQHVEEQPQQLLGGLVNGLLGNETTIRAVDQYGRIRTYTLVEEPLLTSLVGTVNNLLTSLTKVLGVDGGVLRVLEHRLVVPSGAVDQPTSFTLSVLLNGFVEVDLTATAPGRSGLENVGEEGFNRPVRLDMTYSRASNVSSRNEDRLVIIRMNPDGMDAVHEVMPSTVDEDRERVTTWLEHFSGYMMAM